MPDITILAIVIANLATLAMAWSQHWPLVMLLWPYWCQSVIIGWYARKRILALTKFSTDGFSVNDQPVEATPASQRSTAIFFVVHYGFFHFVYLVFLVVMTALATSGTGFPPGQPLDHITPTDFLLVIAASLLFWFTHRASHRAHVAADLRRVPNLGSLMFLPYLRVFPMHITIILGMILGSSGGLLLFGALKTIADVMMHVIEHRWLQRGTTGLPQVVS
ncbi:DUF6498-containing protein [Lysobacter fragariae]